MGETNISGAEWHVMEVIWERRDRDGGGGRRRPLLGDRLEAPYHPHPPCPARGEKSPGRQPDGNRYLYRPLIQRDRCVRQESQSFLHRVFRGDVGELLIHMVRDADISAAQIKQLKRLLNEKHPRNE